jgi:hypothetical protein
VGNKSEEYELWNEINEEENKIAEKFMKHQALNTKINFVQTNATNKQKTDSDEDDEDTAVSSESNQYSAGEWTDEMEDKLEAWEEMFAERKEDEKTQEIVEPIKEIAVDKTKPKEIVVLLKTKAPDKEEKPTKEEEQKLKEEKIRTDFWNYCCCLAKENRKNKEAAIASA